LWDFPAYFVCLWEFPLHLVLIYICVLYRGWWKAEGRLLVPACTEIDDPADSGEVIFDIGRLGWFAQQRMMLCMGKRVTSEGRLLMQGCTEIDDTPDSGTVTLNVGRLGWFAQ
jgi:hypothetical protein